MTVNSIPNVQQSLRLVYSYDSLQSTYGMSIKVGSVDLETILRIKAQRERLR